MSDATVPSHNANARLVNQSGGFGRSVTASDEPGVVLVAS